MPTSSRELSRLSRKQKLTIFLETPLSLLNLLYILSTFTDFVYFSHIVKGFGENFQVVSNKGMKRLEVGDVFWTWSGGLQAIERTGDRYLFEILSLYRICQRFT